MRNFSLFKNKRPHQFDYQPLYWDPKKEALQERIKQIEHDIALEKGEKLPPLRTIQKGFIHEAAGHRRRQVRKSNLRIILILMGLFLFFYYYLYR